MKKILLADDSLTIQKVMGLTLTGHDYELISVNNGEDAILKVKEIWPDLVLADIIMPKKNGYDVCEILKNDPTTKNVPVLLLTSTLEEYDEQRSKQVRADGHIAKPFDPHVLIDTIRKTIQEAEERAAVESLPPEQRQQLHKPVEVVEIHEAGQPMQASPPMATPPPPSLSEEQIKALVQEEAAKACQKVAWEVIPYMAETILKDMIKKLLEEEGS